jgi:hypothetical protein
LIIFIAKARGEINLWLKVAIDSLSHANQFELGSDPDSALALLNESISAMKIIKINLWNQGRSRSEESEIIVVNYCPGRSRSVPVGV